MHTLTVSLKHPLLCFDGGPTLALINFYKCFVEDISYFSLCNNCKTVKHVVSSDENFYIKRKIIFK